MTQVFQAAYELRDTKETDYCEQADEYVSDLVVCRNDACDTCTTDCIFFCTKEDAE